MVQVDNPGDRVRVGENVGPVRIAVHQLWPRTVDRADNPVQPRLDQRHQFRDVGHFSGQPLPGSGKRRGVDPPGMDLVRTFGQRYV